jgi:hypothetical protein
VTGDPLEGFGRDASDFGEAEVGVAELIVLLDEMIGMAAADAGVFGAEFVPGEAEGIEHAGVADLLEALGAGCGATAGDGGEGILETGPGAEVELFFAIHERFSHRSMRDWGKLCCKQGGWRRRFASIDAKPGFPPGVPDCLPNFIGAHEGRRDRVGGGRKWGV